MNALSWTNAQRLEGWAGEIRVNLIRLVALVAFYGNHLVNVFLGHDAVQPDRRDVVLTKRPADDERVNAAFPSSEVEVGLGPSP